MPNQVLIIEPQNELKFKMDYAGCFDLGTNTYMKLTNPTEHTVLFKIKTTAPKKYCVRPNSGFLEPKSKVDIAITPQPVIVETNEKNKHKFMVQSVIAPEGKINIDQVWKEVNPKQFMDYKLKCVFETPQIKTANDSGDNAAANEVTKKRVAVTDESRPQMKDTFRSLRYLEGVPNESNMWEADSSATPSTDHLQKSEILESDLQKATNEVIHLREEESKLRHENLRLKEEMMRLQQGGTGEGRAMRGHSYVPEKKEHATLMAWVATAVAMALLGIIVGKFIM